ncbi:universal stress protein [Haladaptatus salinisoli]|uniref:universal stress protein n=1 Tax=Haladaptatus salinisoli TaxID=2884876 RepID=UPI001D0BAB81|nr:universal stress protein [Haladaptatus salinisoli]
MFDRILIPVDGSEGARRAAKYGLELAESYDAAADVLHVIDHGRFRSLESQEERASRRERATEFLEDAEATAAAVGVPVDTHLREGRTHEVIAAFAAEIGANLLVMGRQGRRGLGDHLLGSIADRVLRTTDVPVLTVPSGDVADDTGTTYEGVLVPTDGSSNAERATPYGADVAGRYDATLHVLNVVDVRTEGGLFSAGGVSEGFIERLESEGAEAVERIADDVRDADASVDVRTAVVRDTPYAGIREYVADNDVDLVVMASRGEANLGGQLLGSVTNHVIHSVDVPVLVVTATGEAET